MTNLKQLTDEKLLAEARGNSDAFGEFYDRHSIAVLRWARRRTGDPQAALELTAEIFCRALEGRGSFRGTTRPSAMAWLYSIAHNTATNAEARSRAASSAMRRLSVTSPLLSPDEFEALDARLDAAATGASDWLDQLSAEDRRAIEARVIDERSYRTLADDEQISEPAARKRVSRALKRLESLITTRTTKDIA